MVPVSSNLDEAPRVVFTGLSLALLALAFPFALLGVPESLPIDIGPGDREYVRGLSSEWSFEGERRWRVASERARFGFPALVMGPGQFSMEVRGPAAVLVLRLDDDTTYEMSVPESESAQRVSFELPRGEHPALVKLELDGRLEVSRVSWESGFVRPGRRMFVASAILLLGVFLAVVVGGGPLWCGLVASFASALALVVVGLFDPFAALHLTLQSPAVVMLGLVIVAVSRDLVPRFSAGFRALVFFALCFRAAILFHPSFYFSDIEMHEVLMNLAYHRGLEDFWTRWPDYAGRFGLGLSPVGGVREPFPYPILFHAVTHLGNLALYAPVPWLKLSGAMFSVLGLFPLGYLARRVSDERPGAELVAGMAYLLVPCLNHNLLLLKFDAATGHFLDLCAVAYLARVGLRIDSPRRWIGAAFIIGASLVGYASGFIHMGLLVGFCLLLAPVARGLTRLSAAGLATAALSGLCLAVIAYQPSRVRDFAVSRVAVAAPSEADEAAASGSNPEHAGEPIDPPAVKAAALLGFPVVALGLLGIARELPRRGLDEPLRLLCLAWLASAVAAVALRYPFQELLMHQKEVYWAGGALAVFGGAVLARLSANASRWSRAVLLLALAALAAEWLRTFWALKNYFFETYLFR